MKIKAREEFTFQDVLDTKLPFDDSTINGDNPNNWYWAKSTTNPGTFYPSTKIN